LTVYSERDASSQIENLNLAFDFDEPQTSIPALPAPLPYVPLACPQGTAQTFGDTFGSEESADMATLQKLATSSGWPIF